MIAVAALAVILTAVSAVQREFRRIFLGDPVEWALQKAVDYERMAENSNVKLDWREDKPARYRELAVAFSRAGAPWAEGSYYGPYTDALPTGQAVITQCAAQVEVSPGDGSGNHTGGERFMIPPNVSCVVVMDWSDGDTCYDDRDIEVRIINGKHAGKTIYIQRIYLRRDQK